MGEIILPFRKDFGFFVLRVLDDFDAAAAGHSPIDLLFFPVFLACLQRKSQEDKNRQQDKFWFTNFYEHLFITLLNIRHYNIKRPSIY